MNSKFNPCQWPIQQVPVNYPSRSFQENQSFGFDGLFEKFKDIRRQEISSFGDSIKSDVKTIQSGANCVFVYVHSSL